MRKNLLRLRVHAHLAVIDDDHAVALRRLVHFMRNQDHRDAVIAVEQPDRPHDFLSALRIEHRCRFIQHDAVRPHRDDARNRNTLLLAARKLVRRMIPIFIHADRLQRLIDTHTHLITRYAEVFKPERYILFHNRRDDLVIGILEYHADMLPDVQKLFFVLCVHPGNRDLAFGRQQYCIQKLCKRRFARAVMPQHRDKLAVFKFQRNALEHLDRLRIFLRCGV